MNRDILCVCYSRTGCTRRAMQEIALALDCELVDVYDNVRRTGFFGWLRCGIDAMRKRTHSINRITPARALSEYRLVILGTPVWAGRCASVMRAFLKRRGLEIQNAAYVITHRSEETYRDVFRQMDLYVSHEHVASVSLQLASTGYHFWRNQFVKNCADFVTEP